MLPCLSSVAFFLSSSALLCLQSFCCCGVFSNYYRAFKMAWELVPRVTQESITLEARQQFEEADTIKIEEERTDTI